MLRTTGVVAEQVLRRYSGGGRSTLTYDQFFKLVEDLQKYQGNASSGATSNHDSTIDADRMLTGDPGGGVHFEVSKLTPQVASRP